VTSLALGSNPGDGRPARVAVLASPGVRNVATAQQVEAALAKAADYMQLDLRRVPPVVVFLANARSAKVQGIPPGTALFVARVRWVSPVYHVWIMAAVNETTLTQAMVMTLNTEFDLHMGSTAVEQTTRAICHRSRTTVSVQALRDER